MKFEHSVEWTEVHSSLSELRTWIDSPAPPRLDFEIMPISVRYTASYSEQRRLWVCQTVSTPPSCLRISIVDKIDFRIAVCVLLDSAACHVYSFLM